LNLKKDSLIIEKGWGYLLNKMGKSRERVALLTDRQEVGAGGSEWWFLT
jgi:hypothetical protein